MSRFCLSRSHAAPARSETGVTVLSFRVQLDWPGRLAFSHDGTWLTSAGVSVRCCGTSRLSQGATEQRLMRVVAKDLGDPLLAGLEDRVYRYHQVTSCRARSPARFDSALPGSLLLQPDAISSAMVELINPKRSALFRLLVRPLTTVLPPRSVVRCVGPFPRLRRHRAARRRHAPSR